MSTGDRRDRENDSGGGRVSIPVMERPPTDPAKILEFWMEWERGDTTPGTVLKNLKNGGLRELIEAAVAANVGTES